MEQTVIQDSKGRYFKVDKWIVEMARGNGWLSGILDKSIVEPIRKGCNEEFMSDMLQQTIGRNMSISDVIGLATGQLTDGEIARSDFVERIHLEGKGEDRDNTKESP